MRRFAQLVAIAMDKLELPAKKEKDSSQIGWTSVLVISCLTVAASASFSYGYGVGAPNMYTHFTEPFLRKQYDICDVDNALIRRQYNCSGETIDPAQRGLDLKRELANGLPQTLFIIGCFIGSLTGGMWYKIGPWWTRKNVFFINLPFTYLAAITMLCSHHFRLPFLFFISRLLHGYQSGMACCIVPPYINEISPQKVRGAAGVFHQFFTTVGILVAQLVGLPFLLATYRLWSFGLSMMAIPCLIANLLIFWLPNSPSEMAIKFNNIEKASKALRRLRGVHDVSTEIEALKRQAASETGGTTISVKQLFTRKNLRWQTITSVTMLFVQSVCGVNAVFFYSSKIFRTAGIRDEYLLYANAITGVINVLATVAVIPLIERLGRRPLMIYPMTGILITFIGLVLCIQFNEKRPSVALGYCSVICVLLFICAFALSLGAIAFIYPNEVFRLEARDAALRVGMCLNYGSNLLLSLCFPAINAALKGYVFLIFFGFVLFEVILLWWKMPETKNKSVEEIERYWKIYNYEDRSLHERLAPEKSQ